MNKFFSFRRLSLVVALSVLLVGAAIWSSAMGPTNISAQQGGIQGTEIAFITVDGTGTATGIDSIQPDGSGRQTIWTRPGGPGDILDVAWKPDATELAFSTGFEGATSLFTTDIYGIQPDGTDIRRITNPPAISTLTSGSFERGTVEVTLLNNTLFPAGSLTLLQLYVQGANSAEIATLPAPQGTTTITFQNVAELGGTQYVVATWAGGGCNISKTPSVPVDVLPNQTVTVNLTFDGSVCNTTTPSVNNVLSLSWGRTGDVIGYSLDSLPGLVNVSNGQSSTWFTAPGLVSAPTFSPFDDSILYETLTGSSATSGIYRITGGPGPGTRLLPDTTIGQELEWAPDGSGFLYLKNGQIWAYGFNPPLEAQLTNFVAGTVEAISLAPDGTEVAFEFRQSGASNILKIVLDPLNLQPIPLTTDGRSTKPDWSSTTPSSTDPTPTPTAPGSPTETPTVGPDGSRVFLPGVLK